MLSTPESNCNVTMHAYQCYSDTNIQMEFQKQKKKDSEKITMQRHLFYRIFHAIEALRYFFFSLGISSMQ